MLARIDEETIVFFIVLFVGIAFLTGLSAWFKQRERRLELLESAIRDPALDATTKHELVRALSGKPNLEGMQRSGGRWLRLVLFAGGWITMFAGIGLAIFGSRYDAQAGGIAALVGFALLALPIALREMEGRATQSS